MPKLIYRFFNGFLDQTIDVSDMLASLAFDGEVGDLNHNLCPLIMYNCFLLLLQPTRSACLQFKYTCIGFMTVQFPLKLQQKHLYLDMVDWVFFSTLIQLWCVFSLLKWLCFDYWYQWMNCGHGQGKSSLSSIYNRMRPRVLFCRCIKYEFNIVLFATPILCLCSNYSKAIVVVKTFSV